MTVKDCGTHEALIEYLYDEAAPDARAAMAVHIAACSRCATEIASLRDARATLGSWTPPEARLGFRVVADGAAPDDMASGIRDVASGIHGVASGVHGVASGIHGVASGFSRKNGPPPRLWQRPLPAWAQAAAAILIFGAGIGLGALRGVSQAPSAPVDAADASIGPVSAQDLAALEQRLRAQLQGQIEGEMQQLRAAAAQAPDAVASPMTSSVTLQQVRALIADSEQRQQRELTLRTAEVVRDFDAQRRGDLARIQQTFGRLEGTMGAEVEQQRQRLNYLLRVSQPGQ